MEEKSKVINLEVEEKKEEKKMKNWSLKKKILVGVGVLCSGCGVATYGRSKKIISTEILTRITIMKMMTP